MSAAYAYGHAGVQPQRCGLRCPLDISARDGPCRRASTSAPRARTDAAVGRRDRECDVDRIATRLGDLPSSLGEEFGSTDDLQARSRPAWPRAHLPQNRDAELASTPLKCNTIAETSHGHVWAETDEMFDHSSRTAQIHKALV